jgi:hypothetical protein
MFIGWSSTDFTFFVAIWNSKNYACLEINSITICPEIALKYFFFTFLEEHIHDLYLFSDFIKRQKALSNYNEIEIDILVRGRNAVLCHGKFWPNFLSEATFNKTNFWFIFFSFLWHKIIGPVRQPWYKIYSTLQVYQCSYSQVGHIPPKMSDSLQRNVW